MQLFNLYPKLHFRIARKASSKSLSNKELKIVNVSTLICFIAIIAEIIYAGLDFARNKPYNGFLNLTGAIILLCTVYLFSKGKYLIGRLVMVYISTCILAINGSFEGIHAGNQFIFVPIITAILILFSKKEAKYLYLALLPVFAAFTFMEYTSYSYFKEAEIIKPELTYINYLICFFVSLASIYLCVFFLNKTNMKWETKLEKLNTLLTRRNAELKKANRELDSYVYKTTHDLRAPLTSLMGLFELIKQEKDIDTIKSYVQLGEKSVHKMDTFIGDILLLSRNSKLSIKIEKITFQDLIDNTFTQLNYLNNSSQISKHISIQNREFYSDGTRLNVVLNNLLANSIRYADYSKEENLIKIDIQFIDNQCKISIWDNGIGIGTSHLQNVFEMFYRATEKTQGSGLGLYIVKDTVEKLGGTISLESREREWTKFTITLPNLKTV